MFSKIVMSHLWTFPKINSHSSSCEEIKKGYSFVYYAEFDLKHCQRHEKPDDGGGRAEIVFILYLYNHRMYKKQSISKTN